MTQSKSEGTRDVALIALEEIASYADGRDLGGKEAERMAHIAIAALRASPASGAARSVTDNLVRAVISVAETAYEDIDCESVFDTRVFRPAIEAALDMMSAPPAIPAALDEKATPHRNIALASDRLARADNEEIEMIARHDPDMIRDVAAALICERGENEKADQ